MPRKNPSKKAHERHSHILQLLRNVGFVSVTQLTETLGVSDMTIRRDLDELQEMELLARHHGGATLVPERGDTEWPFFLRETKHLEEKKKIAKKGASYVQDGQVLIIDAGSTTLQMIDFLYQNRLTVVTNSMPHLSKLSTMQNVNLISAGGVFYTDNQCFLGPVTVSSFDSMNANVAFMAASGLSLSRGMTNRKFEEAEVKKAMITAAEKIVLLVDSSKLHIYTLATVGPIELLDMLITDSGLSAEDRVAIESLEVDVVIAED